MSSEDLNEFFKLDEVKAVVVAAMGEHVLPFVTAISKLESMDEGTHEGTGSYVRLLDEPYLLTNEHIADARPTHSLAHLLGEDYVPLRQPFHALGEPFDEAIAAITATEWGLAKHNAQAAPFSRFAKKHEPYPEELMFVVGFSGERSHYSPTYKTLMTPGTPYVTEQCDVPAEWQNEATFAVKYSSEQLKSIDGSTRGLPMAHGFSGSLVWDTKAMRCWHEGTEWGPELAEVTGLVWGWPTSRVCLLATKIEYVNAFMLHALRRQAAYRSWESRHRPEQDDWTDWFRAVDAIPKLY